MEKPVRNLDEIYDYDGPKQPGLIRRAITRLREKADLIPAAADRHRRVFGR
ncbi:hypothetical protein [Aeromicrobium sp. 179-A 4D2 NHS]|uniref:hypothetical protein n=1 Tax=Aeromicrobium sp. 179-A 4D2 NHS TaxID=3142375 RepID=UPI0039A283C2